MPSSLGAEDRCYKKKVAEPKIVQFALDMSKSAFYETVAPKFGAGPKITTYSVSPEFVGVLRNYRAIFSISIENTADSDLLVTDAHYNVSELGQVMGGAPGPLESNQTYFHTLKYAKGIQKFRLVPPYKIPPKSVGAFNLEVTTDATEPGLCWITTISLLTNLGTIKTKKFQLILTGKASSQ